MCWIFGSCLWLVCRVCLLLVLCLLCGFVVWLGFVLFRFADLGGLFCICLLCPSGDCLLLLLILLTCDLVCMIWVWRFV